MKTSFKNDDGFTFIETLIVIAIISVISSIVGFEVIKGLEKARKTAARAQIDTFSLALDAFYIDTGRYPDENEGLNILFQKPSDSYLDLNKWNGPYLLKKVPKDPWGNDYVYKSPGNEERAYEIVSYGADGVPGGDGKNADIESWEN